MDNWHPSQFDTAGEWFDGVLTEMDPSWSRREAIRIKRNRFLMIAAAVMVMAGIAANWW